ncbi:hypothetical protein F511_40488 [Dorcoceras hygrometricum]|uniref:Uncharacterized protein n=1 Tax=Dorcoceras hygrometricum TaxID=472368 RepID=A0A2Z7AZK4_9LAMI|nr:hypothetical protein F511_40488 [Dorcoceras hygrometricum]
MLHINGTWVIEPFPDYWQQIPRVVASSIVVIPSRLSYVDTLPPVSEFFKLLKNGWADVCIEAAAFVVSGKLLPVGSLNVCRAITVVQLVSVFGSQRPTVTSWGWSQLCTAFVRYSLFSGLSTIDIRNFVSTLVLNRSVLRDVKLVTHSVSVAPSVQTSIASVFSPDVQSINSSDSSADSSLHFNANDISTEDDAALDQSILPSSAADISASLAAVRESFSKLVANQTRDSRKLAFRGLFKSIRQEAQNDNNALSLAIKAVRAQNAILSTDLAATQKEVKDLKEQLASLRAHLAELIVFITKGTDDKKGKAVAAALNHRLMTKIDQVVEVVVEQMTQEDLVEALREGGNRGGDGRKRGDSSGSSKRRHSDSGGGSGGRSHPLQTFEPSTAVSFEKRASVEETVEEQSDEPTIDTIEKETVTTADDVDSVIAQVLDETAQTEETETAEREQPLETGVGEETVVEGQEVVKVDEVEHWFNLSYEEFAAQQANRLVESVSDTDGEQEIVSYETGVGEQQLQTFDEPKNRIDASTDYFVTEPVAGMELTDVIPTVEEKTSTDESMTLEEILLTIPDGCSLPSTTGEVTKIQLGKIAREGNSFSFKKLANLKIEEIYAKEELVLSWAEADSTRVALHRRMYILTKYRELLIRKFSEVRKSNFVSSDGSSATDLKVLDWLSDIHLFVLEELKEQMLAHDLTWEKTCCSKIFEGRQYDRGTIIARSNPNFKSLCCLEP